jgi:hypothetical protein
VQTDTIIRGNLSHAPDAAAMSQMFHVLMAMGKKESSFVLRKRSKKTFIFCAASL